MTTGASTQPVPLEDRAAASPGGRDAPLSKWMRRHEHPGSQITLETVGRATRSARSGQGSQCGSRSQTSPSRSTRTGNRANQTQTRSYRPSNKKHHRTKKRRFNQPAGYNKKTTPSRQDREAGWRNVALGQCFYCAEPIVFTNEYRCENCWADEQQRWPGKDRSVILHM